MKKLSIIYLLFILGCSSNHLDTFDDAYEILSEIRVERKQEIEKYMESLLQQAKNVNNDEFMHSFFKTKRNFLKLKKTNTELPKNLLLDLKKMELDIMLHHVNNYYLFYDILFIDKEGYIFHTVMKEGDYCKNLMQEDLAKTALAQKIEANPQESFVDFQFYAASDEPSSFFVEPVKDSTGIIGWFAFQVSANKLNNLLSTYSSGWETCEVILVNKSQYLLNNSRFEVKSTILQQKIPHENLMYKLKEKEGNATIVDYRGKHVLTSFETFEFLGTEWLISAKVDEDEIMTALYEQNQSKYSEILHKPVSLKDAPIIDSIAFDRKICRVDMDEYQRIDNADILYTKSIHTCTGVLVVYPARFAYMAHISPADRIYKNNGTDLISKIFTQIDEKEITKIEKQQLQVTVVSPSYDAVSETVNLLIKHGVFLSQIKLLINPDAVFADLSYNLESDSAQIFWKNNIHEKSFQVQYPKNTKTLCEIFKEDLLNME